MEDHNNTELTGINTTKVKPINSKVVSLPPIKKVAGAQENTARERVDEDTEIDQKQFHHHHHKQQEMDDPDDFAFDGSNSGLPGFMNGGVQPESEDEEQEVEINPEDDPAQFFAHGKYHTFSEQSIWVLGKGNPIREGIVWIITHKRFDQVVVGLILFNSLLLGIKDYTDPNNETSINQFVENCEPLFSYAFTIECVLKILGMGFILDNGSYLRDAWNWLDFIVVVSSLLTAIPQMQSVSGMRTFRLMRPLRSLTTMPSMKILISTLLASVAQLGGVLVLAIFFFTIFAILGVSLWSGKIYQRCRLTEFPVDGDWVADPEDTLLCSDERKCAVNRWCGSLAEASRSNDPRYALNADIEINRDTAIEDLNYGFSSFNHLAAAFLTIFQCVTLEGWIDITNLYTDAYQGWFVNIYFLLCIIVCSFFVLNLTIAVMLLKYEELDKSDSGSSHLQELHEFGEEIGLPESFVEFIIEQDAIQISQKGLRILKNQVQESSWRQLIKSTATFDHEDTYYHYKLTRVCFYIVNSPIFNGFIIFVILLNTVVLAMDKYPDYPLEVQRVFEVGNTFFTVIFTVEVVIKVTGLGVSGFASDKFNIFDALIVIISLVETFAQSAGSEGGGAFSALRAFRLSRIFKIFRSGDLRTLLDGIAFTVLAVGDYTILLGLFVYVFTLLGMSFFAGKVKFNDDGDLDLENGTVPRANFDKLGWAFLTVFEVMIGENWNAVMYDHMRSVGPASCVYFIGLVIFGNIIMLNLFLAILLGNFDRARNFGDKKKILDAFDSLAKMGYNLNISITYLFDDADFTKYIEEKVLKGNEEKKEPDEDEDIPAYTEKEIRQVYYSMISGTIETILQGEQALEDLPFDEDDIIPEAQREKTIEIIAYIKKQQNLREQRILFQAQLKKTQEQRVALDKLEVQDDVESVASEEKKKSITIFEKLIDHFQNSSLGIFPQNSLIRRWCQLCVQAEDDEIPEEKKPAKIPIGRQESINENDKVASPESKPVSMDESNFQNSAPEKGKGKNWGSKSMTTPKQSILNYKFYNNSIDNKDLTAHEKIQKSKSMAIPALAAKKGPPINKITPAKIFEGVIMTLIITSSVTLVIDNPLQDPEAPIIISVGYLDNCFTISFLLEMSVKIIALGFLFNNSVLREKKMSPYIRNPWNMLDFIVVCASILDFVVMIQTSLKIGVEPEEGEEVEQSGVSSNLQSVKALRALRALRPLRMISRNKGMKLIVNALLSSLPSMTNVTIVCSLFILIFAIIGVNSFKGRLGFCEIDDEDLLEEIFTLQDCLDRGGSWFTPNETFDNALVGCRTLFEMMSTEGWIDVMNGGIDGIAPDADGNPMQPKLNNSALPVGYFVVFMIFGSQFILNLFVGVIMDNFNKIKEKEEMGGLFVTDDQRLWIDAQRLGMARALQKKIDPPEGWRGKFFVLVNHNIFEGIIMFFIAINTVVMASSYDGMPESAEKVFEYLNYLFAFIFNCEMVLKLLGLGGQYFYSAWNLFDMLVVIGTDIGILLNFTTSGSSFSTAATVVRAFRIMRIVRLIRTQQNIKIILDTLVNIIPQITNFIALMFLLLFIYAALGINLFSGVAEGEFVTEKNNFRSIGTAIIYLFRCSTGEDWNKIMHELSVSIETGDCIEDQDYDVYSRNGFTTRGCGHPFSQTYFLSFVIIIAWLIMNLSVAAVIEGLENAKQSNDGIITGDDVQSLLEAWMEYDPKASGWISIIDFVCLIIELPPPFGNPELTKMCKHTSQKRYIKAKNMIYNRASFYVNEDKMIVVKNKDILKILSAYRIQTYEGRAQRVHFKDIYQILVKRVFKEEFEDFEISKYLKTKMKNQWLEKHKRVKELSKTGFKAHQAFSSAILTRFRKSPPSPPPQPSQYAKYANYQNVKPLDREDKQGSQNRRDANLKKIQKAIVAEYHLEQYQHDQKDGPLGGGKTQVNQVDLDDHLPPINQNRARTKNKDENPQEFEEVGSQEEQSQGRAIQQINHNRDRIEEQVSEANQDSMLASAQDLQVRIQMGQSITDSIQGKSEAPHDEFYPEERQESRTSRGKQKTQNRSRSNQDGYQGDSKSSALRKSQDATEDPLPQIIPPRTANAARQKRDNQEPDPAKKKNNFFD